MKLTLKNEEIQRLNNSNTFKFPKYTSQLINWANQNAQGTRPKVVGQMSDMFPEYQKQAKDISVKDWEIWHTKQIPEAIDDATEKIFSQVKNLQEAITLIDRELVKEWVRDFLFAKTFSGMYFQQAVLKAVASKKHENYRLATPDEESEGIDGFIGESAYSVKPDTYKTMNRLSEMIDVKMIYYTKTKAGLRIEVEE